MTNSLTDEESYALSCVMVSGCHFDVTLKLIAPKTIPFSTKYLDLVPFIDKVHPYFCDKYNSLIESVFEIV